MVGSKKNPRSGFNYHSDDEDSMLGGLKLKRKGLCESIHPYLKIVTCIHVIRTEQNTRVIVSLL